jgi:hypothetical protein
MIIIATRVHVYIPAAFWRASDHAHNPTAPAEAALAACFARAPALDVVRKRVRTDRQTG